MSEPKIEEARKRSVDNLQRLYTVVVSLAVTESLKPLLGGLARGEALPGYNRWFMFASLVITVVPFYHGANRYLDATYVTGERAAKPQALLIDFVMLFIEGIAFFALAMLANDEQVFYTGLAMLLVFDAGWVGITNLTGASVSDRFPDYAKWASVNLVVAAMICVSVWANLPWTTPGGTGFWRSQFTRDVALLILVVGRTFYDYWKVWPFYYPQDRAVVFSGIPAPAPARPPEVTTH
ncbi:MAG: hypothetical protein IPK12_01255 [Gemmatimonadetes bacterium]|nr:hypothetical protein [Gemmatimonadota bacterium]